MISIYNKFYSEVNKCLNLIKYVDVHKSPLQYKKNKFLIVELSFLRIYFAWEQLLEDTFIKCVMTYKKGDSSYLHPRDIQHARDLISEGKSYTKWNHQEVIRKSNSFLKKNPYRKALPPVTKYLEETQCIRNSIAHGTKDTFEKFKTLVRGKIGHFPAGITPGEFLFYTEATTKKPFLIFYTDLLLFAAKKIVS